MPRSCGRQWTVGRGLDLTPQWGQQAASLGLVGTSNAHLMAPSVGVDVLPPLHGERSRHWQSVESPTHRLGAYRHAKHAT